MSKPRKPAKPARSKTKVGMHTITMEEVITGALDIACEIIAGLQRDLIEAGELCSKGSALVTQYATAADAAEKQIVALQESIKLQSQAYRTECHTGALLRLAVNDAVSMFATPKNVAEPEPWSVRNEWRRVNGALLSLMHHAYPAK